MAATIQNIEFPTKPRALDTSGNNNHGKIYSGRALEFDGVTDYLDIPSSSTSHTWWREDVGKYNTTACWIRINTHANAAVWVTDNDSQDSRLGLIIKNDGTISFTTWNGSGYTHVSPTNAEKLNLNTWYRIVCIVDNGVKKLYINGIQQTGSTEAVSSGLAGTVAGAARISAPNNSVTHFNGMVSDWQAWDSVWSADDAAYDYANPESLALNASGTALTEGNLKLWYPMQDGHRGQQSYILDGSNTGVVATIHSEDFSTDTTGTNWATNDASVITHDSTNNLLKVTYDSASGNELKRASTVVSGKQYKVTFKARGTRATAFNSIGQAGVPGAVNNPALTTSFQNYEFIITADATDLRIYQADGSAGGEYLEVTDIVVKAINDKHHATTVFYGDELITDAKNRTFASGPDWQDSGTTANQFTQDSGTYDEAASSGATGTALTAYDGTTVTFAANYLKLVATSDMSDLRLAELDGEFWETGMVVGRTYRLSYAIEITAMGYPGGFSIGFGDTDVDTDADRFYNNTRSPAADYFDFVYKGTTTHAKLFLQAAVTSAFTVYLDNFSLKEVGTASGWTDADQQLDIAQPALQSYNEMAWFQDNLGTNNPHASVTHHADFDPIQADFTASAWIYQADRHNNNYFFAKGGGGNSGWHMRTLSTGVIQFQLETVGGVVASITSGSYVVEAGKWYHIVCTINNTTHLGKIYSNGVEVGSGDISTLDNDATSANNDIENASVLKMGSWATDYPSGIVNGSCTEWSIFKNVAFSGTEIVELYNDGKALDATTHSQIANLKGYWRNDGLNSTWKNIANPGTHGATFSNGTQTLLIPQGVDGSRDAQGFIMNKVRNTSCLNMTKKFGAAVVGVDGYVDLGSTRTVADGNAFSLCVWLKPDDLDSNNYFIGGGAEDWIKIQSSNTIMVGATSITDTFTIDTIAAKEWVHVAIVKKANDVGNIYINGDVMVSTIDFDDKAFDYRHLGARQTDAYTFRGQVDGMLIYDDELTGPEVLRNYKATKGSHR